MKKIFLALFVLSLLWGCEEIPDGMVNPTSGGLTLENLYIPDLFEKTDTDSTVTIGARFADNSESPSQVKASVIESSTGKTILNNIVLVDDGSNESGDGTANDNFYSAIVTMSESYPSGNYEFRFTGKTQSGESVVLGTKELTYLNGVVNLPPEISAISAPDTVTLQDPVVVSLLTATVADPNGLADIKSVWIKIVRPDGSVATDSFGLFDDGSASSGDVAAGDGIFSRGVGLTPDTPVGDFTITFSAEDKSGELSNKVIHIMHVK